MTSSLLVFELEWTIKLELTIWAAELNDPIIIIISYTIVSKSRNFLLFGGWGCVFVGVKVFSSIIVSKGNDITILDRSHLASSNHPPIVIILFVEASDFLLARSTVMTIIYWMRMEVMSCLLVANSYS